MKAYLGCIVGLFVLAQSAAAQQPMSVSFPDNIFHVILFPRYEAAGALQGNELGSAALSPVLDSALIEEVAAALHAIRQQIPDLANVATAQNSEVVQVSVRQPFDTVLHRVATQNKYSSSPLPLRDGVPVTGLVQLDSLVRSLRARSGRVWGTCLGTGEPFCYLYLHFPHFMNIPVVARQMGALPAVQVAWPDYHNPTYVAVHLAFADSSHRVWAVSFNEGRGDCPSGCTGSIRSVVHFDRDTHLARLVQRDTLGLRQSSRRR